MNSNDFNKELNERTQEAEMVIKSYLPDKTGYQRVITEAMEYSLMAGGKRLRPVFMQEFYRIFGGSTPVVEPFMAAIEMIHTYSLVHDDLPAMDNDEYRRGRKTTHVVYGEDMGILAGDALLNWAFETALKAFDTDSDAEPVRIVRALQVLAEKAGVKGMIGGQVIDVKETGRALSEDMLMEIFRLKTGALLQAAMMIGAILAGASAEEVLKTEQIAENIGIAFQIEDDLLDVTSTTEELGKPVHSDERNLKTTYVSLHGIEASRSEVQRLTQEALDMIAALPGDTEFLSELTGSLVSRKK